MARSSIDALDRPFVAGMPLTGRAIKYGRFDRPISGTARKDGADVGEYVRAPKWKFPVAILRLRFPAIPTRTFKPMAAAANLKKNQLIAVLPPKDYTRWEKLLQPVHLLLGQVLYEAGDVLSHVYFPTTAIVSLLYLTANGASAEIAVVGNEGLVGISIFMGGESTPSRAVVQSAGGGFRMRTEDIGRCRVMQSKQCGFTTR